VRELVGREGEADDRAREVQAAAEGDRGLDLVVVLLGLGVDVASALVGVGDDVDRDLGCGVGGLLGAVVVRCGALGDDLGDELDVLVAPVSVFSAPSAITVTSVAKPLRWPG
jgi:hypothetical protein